MDNFLFAGDPSRTQKELILSGIIGLRQDAVLVIGC
jgi:hypothetical protein